jgi:hypothetical protein
MEEKEKNQTCTNDRLLEIEGPLMSPAQIEALLRELCVVLGFCLPYEEGQRLMNDPPATTDEFTDAVFRAEGLDPHGTVGKRLRKDMKARVTKHFEAAKHT